MNTLAATERWPLWFSQVCAVVYTSNMSYPKDSLIAVVGVSTDPTKYGHRIFVDLLSAGYNVVGINPKGGTIKEQELFTDLTTLPRSPGLVIIVVPPQKALVVLTTCKELGITNVWMQPGAESGEAQEFAQKNSINLTTNACFMQQEHIW